MALPVFRGLATQIWSTEEQGHGPIVLAVAAWLIWKQWPDFDNPVESRPSVTAGWMLLALGVVVFLLGRSQRILSLQTISLILSLIACFWLIRGPRLTAKLWFPIFFLLFLVPLPAALVDSITQPMKLAVSSVAAELLHIFHLPVARSGVILQVGQYQLLVADACAGLHTLFSLEAMGLLYLNVVRHSSVVRNVMLAILIVPISFAANVIRVVALSLITLFLGDAAGQGFLHGFAGMVLYLSALLLIIGTDGALRQLTTKRQGPQVGAAQ